MLLKTSSALLLGMLLVACGGTAPDPNASSGSTSGSGGAPQCEPGAVEACYEGPAEMEGVGSCKAGTRSCAPGGTWGACAGQVLPAPESCDGVTDPDCNGSICGVPFWLKRPGYANQPQFLLEVSVDGAGDIFVGGRGGFEGGSVSTGEKAIAAKLDSSGNPVWVRGFTGSFADTPADVEANESGGAFLLFNTNPNGTISSEGTTLHASTIEGGLMVELDATGQIAQVVPIQIDGPNGPEPTRCTDLDRSPSGTLVVACATVTMFGEFGRSVIRALDGTGASLVLQSAEMPENGRVSVLQVDARDGGDVVFTGSVEASVTSNGASLQHDGWFVGGGTLDAAGGTAVWLEGISNSSGADTRPRIGRDEKGDVVVATRANDGIFVEGDKFYAASDDIAVLKYAGGALAWVTIVPADSALAGMDVAPDGTIYVVGLGVDTPDVLAAIAPSGSLLWSTEITGKAISRDLALDPSAPALVIVGEYEDGVGINGLTLSEGISSLYGFATRIGL